MPTLKQAKIRRVGNSFGILVPKAFVENDLLKEGKKYKVTFETEVDGGVAQPGYIDLPLKLSKTSNNINESRVKRLVKSIANNISTSPAIDLFSQEDVQIPHSKCHHLRVRGECSDCFAVS